MNPRGCHWTLVGVDLQQKKIVLIDPLRILDVSSSTFVQLLAIFLCLALWLNPRHIPYKQTSGAVEFLLAGMHHCLCRENHSLDHVIKMQWDMQFMIKSVVAAWKDVQVCHTLNCPNVPSHCREGWCKVCEIQPVLPLGMSQSESQSREMQLIFTAHHCIKTFKSQFNVPHCNKFISAQFCYI